MTNLKNLVAAGLTIAGVATTQAQQVVKRVTDNSSSTVVELFVLDNGNGLPDTVGDFNFNTGISHNKGTVTVYNPAIADVYNDNILPAGIDSKSPEQVGDGTFVFDNNQINKSNNLDFMSESGSTLNMTIPQEDGNADSTQDNNTLMDMMYSKFTLPKTLNDGNAIPDGLIVICVSRTGIGTVNIGKRRLGFQRDQATLSRSPIDLDPNGNPFSILQEIGTDGQVLGTDDFISTPSSEVKLFPNPAHESITLDNNNEIPYEIFDVEIYDTTGRQVIGQGSYREGQLLDISMLADGQYIVKSTTDDKETTTKKLIKN